MKKILYYVTDHGRGHATRSIAVIRELQKLGIEVIVRNSNLVDFFIKSLPNITVVSGITDVGPVIKKDGISIDDKRTTIEVGKWINQLNHSAKLEIDKISKYSPDLIISDISAMPFLLAKYIKKSAIGISNFSWYDVLDKISPSQSTFLKNCYDYADFVIQLPLGTNMNHFKNKKKVGYVCRSPTNTKKEIRKQIGIKESQFCIFMTIGPLEKEITYSVRNNARILVTGKHKNANKNLISFQKWREGQDLVLAADLVVCKCGYGIISECLTNGVPFIYVSDDNHKEQKAIADYLSKIGRGNRITLKELNCLNFDKEYVRSFSPFQKEKIDTELAVKYILEALIR